MTAGQNFCIIHEVQISRDFEESISGDVVSDWSVMIRWVTAPVIPQSWQPVDPHWDHKSQVCFNFCSSNRYPFCKGIITHTLPGIAICLIDNVFNNCCCEKELEYTQYGSWKGTRWPYRLCKFLHCDWCCVAGPLWGTLPVRIFSAVSRVSQISNLCLCD